MRYDFDQVIPRTNTCATKWGVIQDENNPMHSHPTDAYFGDNAILPMWVADMDFCAPAPVIDALVKRAQHGIFGYTFRTPEYEQAVVNWMRRRHGWEIRPEWICNTPGVVPGLNLIVRTFVPPGAKVLIQTPVYYPFFSAIEHNGASIVRNPLLFQDGRYQMDYAGLEKIAADPQVKMAILCSPHNPVGRVWTREELVRFGEICLRHDILVVSDEIHGDLIFPQGGSKFIPYATLGEKFAERAIICTAPSKTFNLAGLKTSNIIIPNPGLREKFEHLAHSSGLAGMDAFGMAALLAAYTEGEEWLDQLLAYLDGNLRYLQDYLRAHIPEISAIQPEGTYLVWLDCRRLGLDAAGLKNLFLKEARVYFDEGCIFGPEGEGFERMNIACPRSILADALERIRETLAKRRQ